MVEYDNIARIFQEKGEIKVIYDDCNHPGQSPYPYGNLEQLRDMLARAYVLYQVYCMRYPLNKALEKGTLFPELEKPWPPYYYEETVRN